MKLAKRLMLSFAAKGSADTEEATLQEKEGLVLQILGCKENTLDEAIRHTLTAFQQNNFGVTDTLYVPIGEAVYPHAALLNHSCSPNCVLRYKIGVESSPPKLEIVACKDISRGEELLHSYVDLVLPTEARRKRLMETHGFICGCSRCAGQCTVELPRNRQSWMLWPTKERFGETPSNTPTQQIDIEEAIAGSSRPEHLQIANTSRMLQDRATHAMVNGNNDLEMQLLQQAVEVFLLGGGFSPFHNELYTARCVYLSSLLVNGKIDEAIEQCEHIVSSLSVCLGNVKHHPLLGLQLYTLGDLYSGIAACGEKAANAYRWAYEILTVSHGAQDPMVQALIRKRL